MSTDSNTGRTAVITGASSGIGDATARALAAEGYRVALLAPALNASRHSRSSSATARSPFRRTSPTATRSSPPRSASRANSALPQM